MRRGMGNARRVGLAALALMLSVIWICAPASALGLLGLGSGKEKGPAVSKIADDGMLRVYLKSLGAPEALDLTFAGAYTVENNAGFRFARDAEIMLAADGDTVLLTAGGLTLDMGASVTFTRHAAAEGAENGIYIGQSEKPNLYCGDLTVSAEDGALRAIMKMQIEEYLYGVVAYEMSDSFPLEALKAQAVAARTYAMGRKWVSAARDYDVVDTTADQVYKGYDADYQNVIRAVDETRGIVGVYNGGFAMCYYTASNGGQTALPSDIWSGGGDYGYLDTRDDPYDLENPKSLVNSLIFSEDLSDSAELKAMLEDKLASAAAELPFAEVRLDGVAAVGAADPSREGSRMYETLRFDLKISARDYGWIRKETGAPVLAGIGDPLVRQALLGSLAALKDLEESPFEWKMLDWQAQEETVAVELSVYEEIKDGLSLGLSNSDCELITVSTMESFAGDTIYTLEMRRYGHGVGMSQRGAQQMAGQHDMDFMEILNFYYPGMSVELIDWPEQELTEIAGLTGSVGAMRPAPTALPTPAPLPALEDGEYYAAVRLESASSTLNVRESPSTTARVLDAFESGRRVIVMEELDDGWARIRTAELEGCVKLEYLQKD